MADFTSNDSGSSTSQPSVDSSTTTDATPTTSEVTFTSLVTNIVSPTGYGTTPIWYGGAQTTYMMRARIVSTTTFVYWNSVNYIDMTGIYSGYTPISNLTDFTIQAQITK